MLNFAVLGSAHLDLLSRVHGRADTLDRPGDLQIAYGGTGFNMAVNLAAFGHTVTFGTVLADTSISRTIVAALERHGVRVRPDFHPGLPEAGFSAHIGPDGEMLSAVASTPVERVPLHPGHIRDAVDAAGAVVLECNLAVETIVAAATEAKARGRKAWLAGVSEEKALKLLVAARDGARFDGVFVNARELRFVLAALGPAACPPDLARLIGGVVVETMGAAGVRVWGSEASPLAEAVAGSAQGRAGNWLGAGDHLMALTLHRHAEAGEDIATAACAASAVVTASHNCGHCNLGSANPLEERMQMLTDAALRDPLTGLLNRRGLEDTLAHLAPGALGSFLMLDIDHFKSVNDTWGHDVGDMVLAAMGGVLQASLRTLDCACRWGGEEMVIVMPHADEDDAASAGERLRLAVESGTFPCGRVTCSIGVASGSLDDINALREAADRALYQGKHTGRNRVVRASEVV